MAEDYYVINFDDKPIKIPTRLMSRREFELLKHAAELEMRIKSLEEDLAYYRFMYDR